MARQKSAKKKGKSPRRSDPRRSAKVARAHGRGGDTHLVHVNDNELAQMHDAWGEASLNPNTGLPEYGFFSKLKKAAGFELWHGKKILSGIKPSQLIFGIDPIGTKIGNKVTGSHAQPLVDQLGGARSDRLQQYQNETGRDPGYAGQLQGIAHTIAGFYAGQGVGNLAGAGASSLGAGSTASGLAGRGATMLASRGVATANSPGFSGTDSSDSTGASGLSSGNAPTMTTSTTKIPKGASYTSRDAWFTDTARAALGRAGELATRPYEPYTGDRVAGLSANEQQAGSMAATMGQRYQPMANRLQGGFSTEGLAPYMNPYTDAVLGDRLRTIGNEFGRQSGDLDRNAAATDAFRTGRSDLARSRLGLSRMRAESEATNEVKNAAFESGKDSYFRQGSQDISGIGALSGADSNQISALNQTGGADRSVRQAQADFNYGQHLERRDWDVNNLNNLLSAIGAVNPAAGTLQRGKNANASAATNWGAVIGTVGSAIGEYYGNGSGGSGGGFGGGSAGGNMSDWGGGNTGGGGFGGTYGA